ncbi:molybdopterin-dependent oxidoreductase [Aquipuribacter nitratireducens]|uniref:Molybdopterin-dependent oxidoreductase n=1 Tax=Aquipuribacter nitratireducens TaxID=650104 RepID=A0ABW0GLM3_9MICO
MTTTTGAPVARRRAVGGGRSVVALGALAGLVSAGLLLGTATALAGLLAAADPFVAVGDAVVRLSPPTVTSWAIATFGTYDKLVLFVGIGGVLAVVAAASGALATRRLAAGLVAPLVLVVAALTAVVAAPGAAPLDVLPLLAGTALAAPGFVVLVRRAGATGSAHDESRRGDSSRRGVLVAAAGVGAAAAAVAVTGRLVAGRLRDAAASRAALVLPPPLDPAPPAPVGAQASPATPFRTPPADFYRIDTALTVPQVRAEDWRLRVHGRVERPLDLDWDALTSFEVVEREITLVCVSNPVGGELLGNQVWRGVRLADVLAAAGVRGGADMLLSTSTDGWTASTPLEALVDSDDALLAFAMGGEPLPPEHGYPVRMVVPGLYGYVSATKWVTDLEVTTFADDTAFWTPRGYAERAPVKVGSRIDVPGPFERLDAGTVVVAGVAWAPGRGIGQVEVSVDDGDWQVAELAPVPSSLTWQQWRLEWAAEPGQHRLQVRATTTDGEVQTEDRAPVDPDGATGWHSVVVTVA